MIKLLSLLRRGPKVYPKSDTSGGGKIFWRDGDDGPHLLELCSLTLPTPPVERESMLVDCISLSRRSQVDRPCRTEFWPTLLGHCAARLWAHQAWFVCTQVGLIPRLHGGHGPSRRAGAGTSRGAKSEVRGCSLPRSPLRPNGCTCAGVVGVE
jgi:hypothetical protein